MAGTVANVCYQLFALAGFTAKLPVYFLTQLLDKVNVAPFVEAANVISVAGFSFVEIRSMAAA